MDRRSIIKLITGGLSLGLLSPLSFPTQWVGVLKSSRNIPNKTLAYLFSKFPLDKTDKNANYLKNHDFSGWHSEIHPYLKKLRAPSTGKIVELGVHGGLSSVVLKETFGVSRYMGVDIMPYCSDPQVIKKDIRFLGDLIGEKAALVWNDISTWEGSPRGRLSAFYWAENNLKIGGIYIDEGAGKIPSDISFSRFELLHKGPNFTVFRKVS